MFAIVLAGRNGKRLRPLTSDRPRAMVPLGGKPILEYQVEWLRRSGVSDIVVACGYLHQAIQEYFGDGERWGIRMRYSVEERPLGRGGALNPPTNGLQVQGDAVGPEGDVGDAPEGGAGTYRL